MGAACQCIRTSRLAPSSDSKRGPPSPKLIRIEQAYYNQSVGTISIGAERRDCRRAVSRRELDSPILGANRESTRAARTREHQQ